MYRIPIKLPSLNEYINICRRNKYEAAKFKRDIENEISAYLKNMPRYENPIYIYFNWTEGNKRRDLDNVAFAKKFILDAMVKSGKLKDDNRNCVLGFSDFFVYGNKFEVILTIEEEK